MLLLQIIILLVLIFASAFFSSTETALFSLGPSDLQILAKKGKTGKKLVTLLSHPTEILSTLLIGNTLVNVVIASLFFVVVSSFVESYATTISVVLATIILLLFGEVAPKRIAVRYALVLAQLSARPIFFFHAIFTPLRICLEFFTRRIRQQLRPERKSLSDDELLTAAEVSTEQGVLDNDEFSMLDGVLRLNDMTASDVMTPRVDVIGIDLDEDPSTYLQKVARVGYHYLPIYRGSLDHFEGFLNITAYLLDEKHDLNAATEIPIFVPETVTLDDLLITLQNNNCRIACVTDEYGGTAGIVSRSDILGILADFPHETSSGNQHVPIYRFSVNSWIIDGDASIEEVSHEIGIELSADGADRMAGWVLANAGRILHVGETVEAQNCRVTVRRRKALRINQVLLEMLNTPNSNLEHTNDGGDE